MLHRACCHAARLRVTRRRSARDVVACQASWPEPSCVAFVGVVNTVRSRLPSFSPLHYFDVSGGGGTVVSWLSFHGKLLLLVGCCFDAAVSCSLWACCRFCLARGRTLPFFHAPSPPWFKMDLVFDSDDERKQLNKAYNTSLRGLHVAGR